MTKLGLTIAAATAVLTPFMLVAPANARCKTVITVTDDGWQKKQRICDDDVDNPRNRPGLHFETGGGHGVDITEHGINVRSAKRKAPGLPPVQARGR